MDDSAKLQKETDILQKMVVCKLIKKSILQHYHKALKNARTYLHLEPTKATSSWKIEANQMQFPEPHDK